MKRIPRGFVRQRPTLLAASQLTQQARLPFKHKVISQTRAISRLGQQPGLVEVQHVVLRSRKLTLKRILTFGLASGLGLVSLGFLAGIVLLDDEDEDEPAADLSLVAGKIQEVNKGDALGMEGVQGTTNEGEGAIRRPTAGDSKEAEAEVEEEEDDDDILPEQTPDDAWFIPLGPVKQMPRDYYKGSDPEWQEFIRFSKDKKRQAKVRRELQAVIREHLLRDPRVGRVLGQDVKVHRSWLNLDIPTSPPAEYEQLGIEWAPDYIAVGYRTRPSVNVRRAKRALWPEAVATSAYSTLRELVYMQYNKAMEAMGLKDPAARPVERPGSLPSIDGAHKATTQQERTPDKGQGEAGSRGKGRSKGEPNAAQETLLSILPGVAEDAGVKSVVSLFERKLARSWKSPPPEIPRGTVILQGLVEYEGSRGACLLDVHAGYSVMNNKFNVVNAKLRNLSPHKITPRG